MMKCSRPGSRAPGTSLSVRAFQYTSSLADFPPILSYQLTAGKRNAMRSRAKVAEWFANMRRIVGGAKVK